MLGSDLIALLEDKLADVAGFHRGNLDLAITGEQLGDVFQNFDVVVNCIAYTKVDLAETNRAQAKEANVEIPRRIAQACQMAGANLIHVSTDYVFDGTASTPYAVGDEVSPLGVYGKTKALGEAAVLEHANSTVIRTSWLYGANGPCFPKSIARKLHAGEPVRVVDDQVGSPTHTLDLAEFIYRSAKASTGPVLHGVSQGSCSWFDFARAIAGSLGISGAVSAVPSFEYPTAAPRPAYSVLEPSELDGWLIPEWRDCWARASSLLLDN